QTRSLEALLSTPIRTWELLTAKALAAAIPGILATWSSFGVFALTGFFVLREPIYRDLILGPSWLVAVLLLAPALTMLAVGLGIIISSKVREPHSAQQLGSLVILPLLAALVAQTVGAVDLNAVVIAQTALSVAVLDAIIMVVAVRLFRRETILTTWR